MSTPDSQSERHDLSREARRRLLQERGDLQQQREDLAGTLSAADDARGDRSDQAQALERADDATRLDDRIAAITRELDDSDTPTDQPDDIVAVGSTVTLRYADGEQTILRVGDIVENDPDDDVEDGSQVSIVTPDSPLGSALLGHQVGDTIAYSSPSGDARAEIVDLAGEASG